MQLLYVEVSDYVPLYIGYVVRPFSLGGYSISYVAVIGVLVSDVYQQKTSKEEKQIPNLISFLYITVSRGIEISRCIPKDCRPRGLFPGMPYLPMSSH
jgi:hypothetical protein